MTNSTNSPFPRGPVLGHLDLLNGKLSYEARSSFVDDGPILATLGRIIAGLQADTLPGDVESVSVSRFRVETDHDQEPAYRFEVEIEWSIESGNVDDGLHGRLVGRDFMSAEPKTPGAVLASESRTFYIVESGSFGGHSHIYALLADDGELLNQWVCSGRGFARHDLHDRHPEKQEDWRERFGDYQVLWIGEDDLAEEELIRRNHGWADRQGGPGGSYD